jgi:hypothetical protein
MKRVSAARRRARQRGAVLVEAAFMFPLIVAFFVFNTYIYGSLRESMRVRQLSNESSMYYATHSCQEQDPNNATGAHDDGGRKGGGKLPGVNGVGQLAGANGATSEVSADLMGGATSHEAATFTYMGRSASLKSDSFVMCNEKLHGSSIDDLINFAMNFFR